MRRDKATSYKEQRLENWMTLLNHWGKGRVGMKGEEEEGGKEERGRVGGGRGYHNSQTSSWKKNLLNQPVKGENSENEPAGS